MGKPTKRGHKMKDRKMVNFDGYQATKMMEKIQEANEQRIELGRKPLKICDFINEAVDRVTVAHLVRV